MTKTTGNIILIIMAVVWAYISIISGEMIEVSNQFIYLAGILAGVDVGGHFIKNKKHGLL